MPAALADFCRRTGQPIPAEPGAVVRCALESLALRYRWVLERLEELLGRRLERDPRRRRRQPECAPLPIHGGRLQSPVLAGPVEATAIGNVLVQAIGLGLLGLPGRRARSGSLFVRSSCLRSAAPGGLARTLRSFPAVRLAAVRRTTRDPPRNGQSALPEFPPATIIE